MADMELNLYDVQPASLGGLANEFLYSARLDNLATVFCSIEALVDHSSDLSKANDVSLVALFDHEEIGSQSAHGAGSPVMGEAVRRISFALAGETYNPDVYARCVRNSFVLSCDQAHAVHPNYASKHEANHAPKLNGGVVIKTNSNQRYTTNGVTGFVIRELGRKANVPIQEFVVRNDCPCGSTIGPIISANTGIRTVDVGMPQLSMHSCREVMGIADCKC
jgi:aspartyl aminopeptidase